MNPIEKIKNDWLMNNGEIDFNELMVTYSEKERKTIKRNILKLTIFRLEVEQIWLLERINKLEKQLNEYQIFEKIVSRIVGGGVTKKIS